MTELRGDDLAYAVLDCIRENPEGWSQDHYYLRANCGTTACFAGHAIILALGLSALREKNAYGRPGPEWDILSDGRLLGPPGHLARELLGWSQTQAAHVFLNFTGDFTELETAVKEVLNGEIR